MQAEQRVAGHLHQVMQQAFMGFAGNAFAVVGQIFESHAGGVARSLQIQAEGFGMAQVLEQGGDRGIAEGQHGFLVVLLVMIGDSRWPDPTVTGAGGWLV